MTHRLLSAISDELDRRGHLAGSRLDGVTVGESAVLVEVTDETGSGAEPSAGLAHRPPGEVPELGETVESLLAPVRSAGAGDDPPDSVALAAGVATLNALSAPHVDWRTGDPMALLDESVETVVTVGLFRPAFRKFDDVAVRVVERTPVGDVSTPEGVSLRTFDPEETSAAMAGAEVVFITGSTLVYGGLERYLAAAPDDAAVVVVGATASGLPGSLFDAGADVIAGAHVAAPDRVRAAVADGDCGTALHDRGVRKVYAAREPPSTIRLRSTP
ncbi:Rossmann-like domain-containing protein [Halorussus marinus]|uniref:Rossmann-like domain-containing protein n=1 Tax=Halorussus marinus TaxID=2505976 RepID=UPI001091D4F3|nr:DUF364 domain-containing protein [Halorussus marinus]